jgi:hypothetical protein
MLEANSVSWSIKPCECYILTKLQQTWTCQDCGMDTCVIDAEGLLQVECGFCKKQPPRTSRRKNTRNEKYPE